MKSKAIYLLPIIILLVVFPTLLGGGSGTAVAHPAAQSGPHDVFLPEIFMPEERLGAYIIPFDANQSDQIGPSSWMANYGKTPEIIVATAGDELHLLVQDYDGGNGWDAALVHLVPNGDGYAVEQVLTEMPFLDRVMGLAVDGAGNRYYATAVDESSLVNASYPPLDTYRTNIVRVVKLDAEGDLLFNIDLDLARHAFDGGAEMIINPMVAGSARLVVGGNEIALVHSINTDPDWNIGGARHQKALSTRLNAITGAITAVSDIWVSHSFDQRLLYDGSKIIEHHLGDAYPRYIVFGENKNRHPLFYIKGETGENLTATRLGNVALIENDANYSYLALFATENSTTAGSFGGPVINGPRNLAVVRVHKDEFTVDPALPDTLTVNSAGTQRTNYLRWLTTYSGASNLHAERPKLVGIGNDRYIVLWEQWETSGYSNTFRGIYGMVIDAAGNTLQAAKLLTSAHHLHRGDDAVLVDGRAAWVTGSRSDRSLTIHFVDETLNYETVTVR